MPYSSPLGKTILQLEKELLEMHKGFGENCSMSFSEMVQFFADASCYRLHHVAKEYLKMCAERSERWL